MCVTSCTLSSLYFEKSNLVVQNLVVEPWLLQNKTQKSNDRENWRFWYWYCHYIDIFISSCLLKFFCKSVYLPHTWAVLGSKIIYSWVSNRVLIGCLYRDATWVLVRLKSSLTVTEVRVSTNININRLQLTNLHLDKLAAISQAIISSAFSWMKFSFFD